MTLRRRTPNRNLPEGYKRDTWSARPAEQALLAQRAALILITAMVIGTAGILAHRQATGPQLPS